MFYHAYPGVWYETGAASNVLAWTTDENLLEWHCEKEPVFEKGKVGCWDGRGLYSTWIVQKTVVFFAFCIEFGVDLW